MSLWVFTYFIDDFFPEISSLFENNEYKWVLFPLFLGT